MAVPTIEQICCIVGADTSCRYSCAGVLPTVNCGNSQSCCGHTHSHTRPLSGHSIHESSLPDKTMAHPTLSQRISGAHSLLHPQRNVLDGTQNRLCRACGATLVCHRLGETGTPSKQETPARESSSGGCHLSIGITFESPSYLQYLSNQPKNSLFQWIEFCGFRIQWFSSGKRISLLSTPIILAALNAAIPWSTGTR